MKPAFRICSWKSTVRRRWMAWSGWAGLMLAASAGWSGVEPWADARLAVTKDLEVWLDASQQGEGRRMMGLPQLSNGGVVDRWLDSSGNARHVVQPSLAGRPKFRQGPGSAYVVFDGKDDFLGAAGLGVTMAELTAFVVTAPRSNPGFFRGWLSLNRAGRNDYQTGLNLDMGGSATERLQTINAEGAGFGGQRNLLADEGGSNFGQWHVLALTSKAGERGVELFLDGQRQSSRSRDASNIAMDELTVGARVYSNGAEPPFVQSHLEGEIAEVLVYSRVLPEEERLAVEKYLAGKHAGLRGELADDPAGWRPLETVTNVPPIQVLVPGFTVRELPLKLPNINSLKFRPDGKLYALGYNGHIHLLEDTNGDGLEDRVAPFWDRDTMRGPIGLALAPPGSSHGTGVFVPSKGKLSLIVDRDGDDRADDEVVVATGWKEIPQNVDAVGVAVDRDGSIYFALGTANFANGYLLDDLGVAHYDLASERGTVLRVSPDFSKREVVCTGMRFPVAMAFNRHGDLFCTDQEGATWLPNGNPLDELLHIQPGRHFGFPPRHPRHLPGVVDEPSVFDYRPQHQSTCGLCFNEPVNGGPTFGPASWADDVFVAGESRGKIWRTSLRKTAQGYVARSQLIACVAALATDVCVSPSGELVVSGHSGEPDWGTGPNGIGKLWKIAYVGRDLAQPVVVWSSSPSEIGIAFDRPLESARLRNLNQTVRITQGEHVGAGDRFETLRPGYQVVQDQLAAPRYNVPVLSTAISSDRRTLLLTTPSRTAAVNYAIELPASIVGEEGGNSSTGHPQIDLAGDLHGVEAQWESVDGQEHWRGWLPHPDLHLSREFTRGSAEHERLWRLLGQDGQLTLRTRLDLAGMLQPAVQPGATLDYAREVEEIQISMVGQESMEVTPPPGAGGVEVHASAAGTTRVFGIRAQGDWPPLAVRMRTPAPVLPLEIAWTTERQRNVPRPFPMRRFLLPWAEPTTKPVELDGERQIPELAGGDWLNGRRVFFGEQAGCAKCHRVRSEGGALGPDLSNLIHRDYASVRRDIREPSAAINPDHAGFEVELDDGESLSGVLVADAADALTLGDSTGKTVVVSRNRVRAVRPATLSIMPEGLEQALGESGLKDLLTFLLMPPPLEPGPIEIPGVPPPRKRADVERLLGYSAAGPGDSSGAVSREPLLVVLCAGPKDHGPGEHDYPLWRGRWSKLLALDAGVEVGIAEVWPSSEQLARAGVLLFFNNNPGWNEERGRELDAFLARGGGAVYFHWAVEGREAAGDFARRIGLASDSRQTRYRHGPIDLEFHPHPIANGFTRDHFTRLNFVDETYWNLVGDPKGISLVASAVEDGAARPQMWTREVGRGRVVVCLPGHYNWTFDDPVFRVLALRGLCWAARQPLDRLGELATIGARVVE